MTDINDIIEEGAEIPADVTAIDAGGDSWLLQPNGHWHSVPVLCGAFCNSDGAMWLSSLRPLTVTAVREPDPTAVLPTRRLRACVENWPGAETGAYDPHCCRFPKSCSATVYDADRVSEEDLEPEPSAQPADVSVLLDLVRQYGHACWKNGDLKGQSGESEAFAEVQDLFGRIAALVPQQPDDEASEWKRRFEEQAARGDADVQARLTLRRERNEARAEVEQLKAMLVEIAPAQPDPSVLSLPQVPDGAVALIGKTTGVRYDRQATSPVTWGRFDVIGPYTLLEVFQDSGPELIVVMREPRTWPQLDDEPEIEDPPAVVDVGEEGRWRRVTEPGGARLYTGPGDEGNWRLSLRGLRYLGDVTEVFEDEPSGEPR